MDKTSLGDRMKSYEEATRHRLPPRMPVVVRVDGKAFHTWTRGLDRPYDQGLVEAMDRTCLHLVDQIDGAVLGYVQSDEISILLHPFKTHLTSPWLGGGLQKTASVSAGLASAYLTSVSASVHGEVKPAVFDSRAFVIPERDVCNYFVWRQQDASRNSIQTLARSIFSHKECHGKDTGELRQMCRYVASKPETERRPGAMKWDDLALGLRVGRVAIRRPDPEGPRRRWQIEDAPVFKDSRGLFAELLAVLTETQRDEADRQTEGAY